MKKKYILTTVFLIMLFLCMTNGKKVRAEEEGPKAVTIGATDYEDLTMKIYLNGNSIVYISTDKGKTWNELDGNTMSDNNNETYIETDISWASPSSNVKLMFKGNIDKTEVSCQLPKQDSFKVKFNKVTGDFEFTNTSDATKFWWRKSTDYYWNEVSLNTEESSYKDFLAQIGSLRFKGAKLVFRIGQKAGTGAEDMGRRPSKEVNVSITKFASAPSLKLNVVKMTLNTKATMEYTTDLSSNTWYPCEKSMAVYKIAPDVFAGGQAEAASETIYFRVAATEKKAASLISIITIPAQTLKPDVGDKGKDVVCAENSDTGKFELKFESASETNMFEYCVVAPGKSFELTKAKWKTVKGAKTIALSKKNAPDGTIIYIRFKGTAENVKKDIKLKLPSEYAEYTVKWSGEETKE